MVVVELLMDSAQALHTPNNRTLPDNRTLQHSRHLRPLCNTIARAKLERLSIIPIAINPAVITEITNTRLSLFSGSSGVISTGSVA